MIQHEGSALREEEKNKDQQKWRRSEQRRQWREENKWTQVTLLVEKEKARQDMEEEWPYPLLSKEIDARHRAKKISDGNSCSSLAVLIPRTTGWWGIDRRWKPRQKRQAGNRYHWSMHLRMTPWIETWSQALNDVVHETRAYDHNTYEQYMA
uniref:Uncharacterized protein n=1 Tax=Oryza punctata TaxID=4537 RepID=A0A0E0JLE7_ORYPU